MNDIYRMLIDRCEKYYVASINQQLQQDDDAYYIRDTCRYIRVNKSLDLRAGSHLCFLTADIAKTCVKNVCPRLVKYFKKTGNEEDRQEEENTKEEHRKKFFDVGIFFFLCTLRRRSKD